MGRDTRPVTLGPCVDCGLYGPEIYRRGERDYCLCPTCSDVRGARETSRLERLAYGDDDPREPAKAGGIW